MNVHLTPELEQAVREKVATGLYNNHSEVVREALRLLLEKDRAREAYLSGLRDRLSTSLAQAERGELHDADAELNALRASLSGEPD